MSRCARPRSAGPAVLPVFPDKGNHRLSGRQGSAAAKQAEALRSKAFMDCETSSGMPAPLPLLIAAFLIRSCNVKGAQPVFPEAGIPQPDGTDNRPGDPEPCERPVRNLR